jgi:hypothetical protein
MRSLAKSLATVLTKSASERPVCRWLKQHPLVLSHALGGFPYYVVAEFPFGSEFRADFVRLCPFSGGWDIGLVELEPPGAALFTKLGVAAKRLNGAVAQIDAWRSFIATNRQTVLRDLSKFLQRRELVLGKRDDEPADHCGRPLYHPNSWLRWHYHILIGRRSLLRADDAARKGAFFQHHGIDVGTYDRLLDAARKLDAYNRLEKDSSPYTTRRVGAGKSTRSGSAKTSHY